MKCCLLHTCIHTHVCIFVQEFGWNGSLYGIVSESINNRAIKWIVFLVLELCLDNHEPVVNFLYRHSLLLWIIFCMAVHIGVNKHCLRVVILSVDGTLLFGDNI